MNNSIFSTDEKPKWKTLQGCRRTDLIYAMNDALEEELGKVGEITYWAQGLNKCHEMPSGGLGPTKNVVERPATMFEIALWVQRANGRKQRLYLISSVGWYAKGAIFHCGWQFPHCRDFDEEAMEFGAFKVYVAVVRALYRGIPDGPPKKVAQFLLKSANIYRQKGWI